MTKVFKKEHLLLMIISFFSSMRVWSLTPPQQKVQKSEVAPRKPAASTTPSTNMGADLDNDNENEIPDGNSFPLTPRKTGSTSAAPTLSDSLKIGSYVELDPATKNDLYGTINYPNAELKDIIQSISKLANKNFILDRKIENRRVTILSPQPVTKQEAYNAFLSALYMNDLTVVSKGPFLEVVESKSAIQSNTRVFVGDYVPASEEIVTLLYPLKFLNAEEIQRFLTDLVPRNGRISAYPNTNTLVMTDTGLNLRRIMEVLRSIDVAGHEDQLESIQIRYASAKGISTLIEDILDAQSGRSRNGPTGRFQPQKTRGGGIITKIVPDERTNSLVVLANGRGVLELKHLVERLDTPDAAGGGNIHIYFCKNAVAEELATTINTLLSGTKSNTPGGPGGNTTNPQPGLPLPLPSTTSPRAGADGGVRFEGNIKVTFDKPTNALVVVASGSDFAALKNVLRKLDIPRQQVYVEGTIMEINTSKTNELNGGVNVAAPGFAQAAGFVPSTLSQSTFTSLVSTPAGVAGLVGAITAGTPVQITGVSGVATGTVTIPTVLGLIKAIEDAGAGQILDQPQILTSDNQDAEVKVTTRVPTVSQTTSITAVNSPTTATYNKEDIVISLKITPQIGVANDLIKLKVEQSVDDYTPAAGAPGQNTITQRKANTTVVVRNGDTIVIGGLQQTKLTDNRSKFPLLGDIPILGFFFRGSNDTELKTNLTLFLTPHIIAEYKDLMKITGAKLEERAKVGSAQYDPKDRLKDEVAKMRAENNKNMQKPPPKGWGFRPTNYDESDSPNPEAGEKRPEAVPDESGATNRPSGNGVATATTDGGSFIQTARPEKPAPADQSVAPNPPSALTNQAPPPTNTIPELPNSEKSGQQEQPSAPAVEVR